jgi:hypothetical protein
VVEWHPGFPSRRRSDAGELAMDLVRHHADKPNPNGDRTTIGRKRLPRTAGKMEQPSCGTDRPGSCSDAIIPVGAGVGRPHSAAIVRRRLSDRPCAMKDASFSAFWSLTRGAGRLAYCARDALQNLLVDKSVASEPLRPAELAGLLRFEFDHSGKPRSKMSCFVTTHPLSDIDKLRRAISLLARVADKICTPS